MPAFEDKLVQRAVAMLLGAIYEQDFHDGSYGFREGRSPHQALHVWRERCMQVRIGWIVDADVSACFDSLDHVCGVRGSRNGSTDGAILRLIRKWLKAGVLEGETLSDPERGSPQGAVVTLPTKLQNMSSSARRASRVHRVDPAMGPGVWAPHAPWWSLTTSPESGSEEAVRARRDPTTTKALAISVRCEPSRLRPAGVAQAYAEVVPRTQRSTARASHRGLAGRENTGPPGGRRAAACPRCRRRSAARVASAQQAEAQTVARQVAAWRARVAAADLPLPAALPGIDAGDRGATLVRPALERRRDLAAAGAWDRLSVHSPERWARTDAYPVRLGDAFPHAGVEVICFNRALGQSPEDDLRRQVQGLMAEYERAKMIERHRRGTPHAARAGTVNGRSGAPEGYHDLAKDAGHGQARDAVVPDDARVVRPVCDGVGCDGLTIGAVCRRLTQAGDVTRRGKPIWDRRVVWGMWKHPASMGSAAFGKTPQAPLRPRLRPQRRRPLQPRRAVSTREVPPPEWITMPVPAHRGAGGLCHRSRAVAGPSTPRPTIASGSAVCAPRRGAVPTRRLCLRWQTPQPQCPHRQTPGVCL